MLPACVATAQSVSASKPFLKLAWNYEGEIAPHGFIVKLGKDGERNEDNPYPTTLHIVTDDTFVTPPPGAVFPPLVLVATQSIEHPTEYGVTIGDIAIGEYYSVISAYIYRPDGTIFESENSTEIQFSAYTISVTESEDGVNWTETIVKSFISDKPRKFLSIKFKKEDDGVIPVTTDEPRRRLIPPINE